MRGEREREKKGEREGARERGTERETERERRERERDLLVRAANGVGECAVADAPLRLAHDALVAACGWS